MSHYKLIAPLNFNAAIFCVWKLIAISEMKIDKMKNFRLMPSNVYTANSAHDITTRAKWDRIE